VSHSGIGCADGASLKQAQTVIIDGVDDDEVLMELFLV
jgi:hypothetical protein